MNGGGNERGEYRQLFPGERERRSEQVGLSSLSWPFLRFDRDYHGPSSFGLTGIIMALLPSVTGITFEVSWPFLRLEEWGLKLSNPQATSTWIITLYLSRRGTSVLWHRGNTSVSALILAATVLLPTGGSSLAAATQQPPNVCLY